MMEPESSSAGLTARQVNELAKRHLVAELAARGVTAALGPGSAVTITAVAGEPVQLFVRAKRGPVWQTSTTYGSPRSEPDQPEGRFWSLSTSGPMSRPSGWSPSGGCRTTSTATSPPTWRATAVAGRGAGTRPTRDHREAVVQWRGTGGIC